MRRAAAAVSALLVAGVLGVVLLGVARRYLLGVPLSWTDELASVLFIWLVFWTAALAVPLREHVSFDLLTDALPARARRWIAIVTSLVVAMALLAALPKTIEYVERLCQERPNTVLLLATPAKVPQKVPQNAKVFRGLLTA